MIAKDSPRVPRDALYQLATKKEQQAIRKLSEARALRCSSAKNRDEKIASLMREADILKGEAATLKAAAEIAESA